MSRNRIGLFFRSLEQPVVYRRPQALTFRLLGPNLVETAAVQVVEGREEAGRRFDEVTAMHDPGCGLGRAAPDALRACCEVTPAGVGPLRRSDVEGCFVLTFTTLP